VDLLTVFTIIVGAATVFIAWTQLNVMSIQRDIMDEQSDLMNRQLALMEKQDAIISAQLSRAVSLECMFTATTPTRPTINAAMIYTLVVRNNGTKTADGFYWHVAFDSKTQPELVPWLARPERGATIQAHAGTLFRGFSAARIYPHTPFELCSVRLTPTEDGTFVGGWRLSSEDFVSPEADDFNVLEFVITTAAPE